MSKALDRLDFTIGTLPMGPDGQPPSAYLLYLASQLATAVTASYYLCGIEDVQSGAVKLAIGH